MSMDNFYKLKNCERCGVKFEGQILRIQSWFNNEVICSLHCNSNEKVILQLLGERKYEYEDCGIIPTIEQLQLDKGEK